MPESQLRNKRKCSSVFVLAVLYSKMPLGQEINVSKLHGGVCCQVGVLQSSPAQQSAQSVPGRWGKVVEKVGVKRVFLLAAMSFCRSTTWVAGRMERSIIEGR